MTLQEVLKSVDNLLIADQVLLLEQLKDEIGADIVEQYLLGDDAQCMIHNVNICEVYYGFLRSDGESFTKEFINRLEKANVIFRFNFIR